MVRLCIDAYLTGRSRLDPLVSPLLGDLSGLPPLLIQAATGDVMLGDAQALHDRAEQHGVRMELQLYPSDAHAFQLFWSFLPEAADAIEAPGRFVANPATAPGDAESAE